MLKFALLSSPSPHRCILAATPTELAQGAAGRSAADPRRWNAILWHPLLTRTATAWR